MRFGKPNIVTPSSHQFPKKRTSFNDPSEKVRTRHPISHQSEDVKAMKPFDSMSVYRVTKSAKYGSLGTDTMAVLNPFEARLYFYRIKGVPPALHGITGLWDGERPLPTRDSN